MSAEESVFADNGIVILVTQGAPKTMYKLHKRLRTKDAGFCLYLADGGLAAITYQPPTGSPAPSEVKVHHLKRRAEALLREMIVEKGKSGAA